MASLESDRSGLRLVVGFSGGPDSTALLWGLARLRETHTLELLAAHLDHSLDPGSERRALHARDLASTLGVAWRLERRAVMTLLRAGESLEAGARRVRYAFLDEVAATVEATAILTAHHRDDQAETVALRIAFGSGWAGLAGIAARRGRIRRPLLGLPSDVLRQAVEDAGLRPVHDVGNSDRSIPRNRLRLATLPRLGVETPRLPQHLIGVASQARRARRALARRLGPLLEPAPEQEGASMAVRPLASLPDELAAWALGRLHRLAAAGGAPPKAAVQELLRQVRDPTRAKDRPIGCDCGHGWRWEADDERLRLIRQAPIPPFDYTFTVPGDVEILEVGCAVRLRPATLAPWMLRGERDRAGLALALRPGDMVTVRSRRPGDRIQPLGAPGRRRLKEVLIDRRIPRRVRDGIPLLVVGGRIAWVPGVTVDESCRLRPDSSVWLAELARSSLWNPRGVVDVVPTGLPSARTVRPLKGT